VLGYGFSLSTAAVCNWAKRLSVELLQSIGVGGWLEKNSEKESGDLSTGANGT
jgi:hypothetical protein